MWATGCHLCFGTGPMPGGEAAWVTSELVGMCAWNTLTISSVTHRVNDGRATERPTVAMIFADSVARASGRNTATFSSNPSSGANTAIVKKAAGTMFQCRPLCNSKYRKALEKATAPYEKLKIPVALYDRVMPAAMSE